MKEPFYQESQQKQEADIGAAKSKRQDIRMVMTTLNKYLVLDKTMSLQVIAKIALFWQLLVYCWLHLICWEQ